MEVFKKVINLTLCLGLVASPFLILIGLNKWNIKYKLLAYLILTVISTSIITLLFGWWVDLSTKMLLSHYGYNFDAMNDLERFAKVSEKNMPRVKTLEISMMGIGWPIKAFMIYVVFICHIY